MPEYRPLRMRVHLTRLILVVRVTGVGPGEETTMTLPTLTPEQRAEALEKAAAARSQRARIKSELKSGELKLSEFFAASETDEVLGKMKVRALSPSPGGCADSERTSGRRWWSVSAETSGRTPAETQGRVGDTR